MIGNKKLSSPITPEAHVEALKRIEVDKEWYEYTVMNIGKQKTVVLIPVKKIAPRYRDEMPAKHFNPLAIPNLFLSRILKAPELTLPSKYMSSYTRVHILTACLQLANMLFSSRSVVT
jgi:hypothetical protein